MDGDQTNGGNSSDNTATDIVDPDDIKHQQAKSPAVLDEENTFLGQAPEEPADIDEELKKVGLEGDEEGIKPLGED